MKRQPNPNYAAGVTLALVLALWAPTQAHASDPRNLDVRDAPTGLVGLDTTLVLPHLSPYVALSAGFANDELVLREPTGKPGHGPLQRRWTARVGAGLGLFDILEVGVGAPLIVSGGSGSDDLIGIGDLALVLKGRIWGAKTYQPGFGLGLAAEIRFPTGDADNFAGDGGVSGNVSLVVDYRDPGTVHVALNLGARLRDTRTIGDLAVGHELRYSLGVEVPLRAYGLSALMELHGGIGLVDSPADTFGFGERKAPLEALGAVRWRHVAGVDVVAGFGGGITAGYGAPDFRALVRVGWALGYAPEHAFDPSAAPLRSGNGNGNGGGTSTVKGPDPKGGSTTKTKLATPPTIAPLEPAAFDQLAAADPDSDGDGIPRSADKCPDDPEDLDKFQDSDGCPDLDNDLDGVADAVDKCPLKKETVNGVEDEDGCPDEGAADVVKTGSGFELKKAIFFGSGSDKIKAKSFPLLRQVAALLKASPEVKLVHIEGHTDNRGNKDKNVDLSIRRAFAVKFFLVERGVASERLAARGYGPTRPIASNKTGKGRAKNRRVAFVIKEIAGKPSTKTNGGQP